ncbi:50S ribosomal protein L31 [Mycoplasmopsis californica]|uniref:50S ribosomal protein L31 n=1 Tax=Mycoplasmopsis equigenitalium TaxID=114883 RepID=A0ABY5J1N1_9BACT|nr:50S ribosomal protein L31 [Mycoplasmopsis equigenitalium]UUD37154.1 50S ribosomal protein L31 [Mycoplasmopsis equigenitalium]VEU69540.1 50S ribosomal protein L31 [Mycoplasmopsis californica]
MKKDIHPKHATITAACTTCNTKFEFGSSKAKISVDVCSGCHPVYTGDRTKAKATGRIERFNRLLQAKNNKKK